MSEEQNQNLEEQARAFEEKASSLDLDGMEEYEKAEVEKETRIEYMGLADRIYAAGQELRFAKEDPIKVLVDDSWDHLKAGRPTRAVEKLRKAQEALQRREAKRFEEAVNAAAGRGGEAERGEASGDMDAKYARGEVSTEAYGEYLRKRMG